MDKVILVGNPNVGKSVIFSNLTGRYAVVSNYPGTTVEITNGRLNRRDGEVQVIDTPGVHSLLPRSEDEIVTLRILLESQNDFSVVQVVNALNLKRGLLITAQLMMMGVPIVLDLNIIDEAKSRGIDISEEKLEKILGIPVVKTVATRREGIRKLKNLMEHPTRGNWFPRFDEPIERAIEKISSILPLSCRMKRFISLLYLGGRDIRDEQMEFVNCSTNIDQKKIEKIEVIKSELDEYYGDSLSYQINNQINREVENLYECVVREIPSSENRLVIRLGQMMMHPILGLFFAALVLLLIYFIVGKLGAGDVVDFFEGTVFSQWINPFVTRIVELFDAGDFVRDLIIGKYGLWTMGITYAIGIVMPIVALFFLIFGILEDSGYLPRLAVMLNKPFKMMGLSGRAVLPMVLGLGCATMATLTARILDTKKERVIVTFLLALAIPCSAQLGVIMGMLGIISTAALFWWLGSLLIVLIAAGKLASMIIPGENAAFIQEVPPLRIPQLKNLTIKTIARLEWYLKEAVPLFLAGTLILFILDRTGAIGIIEKATEPVLSGLMGLPKEAAGAFVMGFLRRDYAATGLFDLARSGLMNPVQTLVSLVAITLFIPCIANLFIIIKERGWKTALWIVLIIFPFSILFSSLLNLVLNVTGVTFR